MTGTPLFIHIGPDGCGEERLARLFRRNGHPALCHDTGRLAEDILFAQATGTAATLSSPRMSPLSWRTWSAAAASSVDTRRACSNSTWPWAVGSTPREVRTRSGAASSISSSRTILVSAGCDTPTRRAAPRRLPSSMAATRAWSVASFMVRTGT